MGILDADLGSAGQKRAQIIHAKNELYSLIEAIKTSIDELHPYLKGNVTDSSYQKLSDNINELLSLKDFVDNYTSVAGGVINRIVRAIEEMQNNQPQ